MQFDIILPTIGRDSLRQAIESVHGQIYRNFHLYIIDDTAQAEGHVWDHPSSQTTLLACRGPHNDNGTYARNFGIQFATYGSWIAYIDCDDVWMPNHLTTIVEHVRLHPQVNMIHTAGQAFRWKHKHPRSSKLVRRLYEINATDPMTVGMAHTRELYNKTNGWKPVPEKHDHVLWQDMLLAGGIPAVLDAVTFEFGR